jgi:hypothetical protein
MEPRAVHATLWAESSPKVNGKPSQLLYIVHDVTQTRLPIDSYCGLLAYVCVWPALTCDWQTGRETRFSGQGVIQTYDQTNPPRAYIQWYMTVNVSSEVRVVQIV